LGELHRLGRIRCLWNGAMTLSGCAIGSENATLGYTRRGSLKTRQENS